MTKMDISIIVAMTKKRVIGKDNKLLWHIPEDLKNFKRLTSGNTVIMGRKTFESILSYLKKPLPNRHNIVLTRNKDTNYESVDIAHSIEDAIEIGKSHGKDIFVIGGASIYKLALPYVNKFYISWIKKDYEGDALFPEYDFSKLKIIDKKEFEEFDFVVYEK